MKKRLKKAFLVLGSILLFFLLVIVIASLLFFYRKPLIKRIVEKQVEKQTGIRVAVGTLDYWLFPLRIEAGSVMFKTKLEETEVDVFVGRLILRGDIHRIRKKARPYFESIEAEGVRIISYVGKARKKIAVEDILHGLSSGMSYVRKIGLRNSSFKFIFSKQELSFQEVEITLSSSWNQESIAYTLLCQKAQGIFQSKSAQFQNAIQASGTLFPGEKPAIKGGFVFTSNRLAYAAKEEYFEKITVNFDGAFDWSKEEFIFQSLQVEIPSFTSLTGSLDIILKDELTFSIRPRLQVEDLGRFYHLVKDRLPREFEGLELQGSALFEGEARIKPPDPGKKLSLSGLVVLNPSRIKFRTAEYQLDCPVSGDFRIARFPDDPEISGRLKISDGSLAGKAVEAHGIGLDIPFVYDHKESILNIASLKAGAFRLDIPYTKIKTNTPRFFGQGFLDLKKKRLHILRANVEVDPFPVFYIKAQAGLSPQDAKSFSVKSSQISFQSVMDFFSFAVPKKVMDWEPDGRLNVQIEARHPSGEKEKGWHVAAELESLDVKFHDPSFTAAGEALRAKLTLEGTLRRPLKEILFRARMELYRGESLWKDFYVDWSRMPLQSTVIGRFDIPQKKLTDFSLGLAIPGFGEIDATGRLDLQEPRFADLKVTASAFQLAALSAFFNQRRAAGQTQGEWKGEAESRVNARFDKNALSILGFLRVKDTSWTDEARNLAIQGIEAHLPVHYDSKPRYGEADIPSPEDGYLHVQKIRAPYLDLSSLRLDIKGRRNGYSIQPFALEIFGEEARVGEISIEYRSNPSDFKALTSFSWMDGDLSQAPFSSRDFQLEGKLSLDLPRVAISPDLVSTEGVARANAFGGTIAIKNIQMERPFTKNRTISCDVALAELDLEKITDSIPFGRVTGIINGEIQDLALSYGQPERFDIRIESERRKGVQQRFSVKATDDLTILGTGERTALSSRSGWTRFVREFRYDKIGIACSLKNDIFSLQGTIWRNGVEYLVRGTGLFAINVVNKQARNQIRFKDMLNRLQRIGQSKQSP
ncbi:MAG: hypothetical protein QHH14_08175 [Clostridiales bacterium]|nr:hypothetical protein [Clostridiales bacterium]